MDPNHIALFALADRRLAWASQRQQVLAQNVANANTPGWRSSDMRPFADILAASRLAPAPVPGTPEHLAGTLPPRLDTRPDDTLRAPDGNGVQLDAELSKVADTETTQALVTGLYTKYLGMFRIALGR